MTGNRRELARSSVAGRRRAPAPHRGYEGPPWGWAHSATPAASSSAVCPEWLLGADRPDEAGEPAGAGDDDLLVWFAAGGHSPPALVEPLLAAPGTSEHGGVLAALAAG